jgi:WhiB family redox-sensing transcriptional regulator
MEVTPMQLATLDRDQQTGSAEQADALASLTALTALSSLAERVADEQLPCRVNDPELFFADSPADVEYAKSLCTTCPARLDCLAGALERAEPWGVWGGEWFVQGVVVPRKRPRGRPRKSEVAA